MGDVVALDGWENRAACRGAPIALLDLFFGPEDESAEQREIREARARNLFCSRCEVRAACRAAAALRRTEFGVWGDEGEADRRRRLRRERETRTRTKAGAA